ncbi:hypothetical protein [Aurantivibrio infirmus]
MIIFVVTSEGFKEMEPLIKTGSYSVWLGGGVISREKIEKLRKSKLDISVFSQEIDPANKEQKEESIHTIMEHHPGERIWLEYR